MTSTLTNGSTKLPLVNRRLVRGPILFVAHRLPLLLLVAAVGVAGFPAPARAGLGGLGLAVGRAVVWIVVFLLVLLPLLARLLVPLLDYGVVRLVARAAQADGLVAGDLATAVYHSYFIRCM